MAADRITDSLYADLRARFGGSKAGANGYQFQFFFRREQAVVLSLLKRSGHPLVDIACGSGLMLAPLLREGLTPFGVDYNETACKDAKNHGLAVLRGDAFDLPFRDNSVAQAINCQFLNQQTHANTSLFLQEASRVLQPGGRLILLWRHGESLIHRLAATVFHLLDRLAGRPEFPQYLHPVEVMRSLAVNLGFRLIEESVTLPIFLPRRVPTGGLRAWALGASLVFVLEKPVAQ